jgi:hypothetical protein
MGFHIVYNQNNKKIIFFKILENLNLNLFKKCNKSAQKRLFNPKEEK